MSQIIEVKVPDIGDFSNVPVIDLFVKVGDSIKVDDAIATLESDKATMDVPSTAAGVVKEVLVQLGSRVSEGSLLIRVDTGSGAAAPAPQAAAPAPAAAAPAPAAAPVAAPAAASSAPAALAPALPIGAKVHASPSVRALAAQGYTVDVPPSIDDLRRRVLEGNADRFGTAANVAARIPVDAHVRREAWLPEFPLAHRYERDRDPSHRDED